MAILVAHMYTSYLLVVTELSAYSPIPPPKLTAATSTLYDIQRGYIVTLIKRSYVFLLRGYTLGSTFFSFLAKFPLCL